MNNYFTNRRAFLKLTAGLTIGGGLSYYFHKSQLGEKILQPNNNLEHFVVIVSVPGGLDVTQGLDPQIYSKGLDISDIFIEYNENQIIKTGNIQLGPAAKSIAPFYKDICIVNGLSARQDVGHKLNLQQMLTGTMDGSLNHFAIQLASLSQQAPLGTLTNTSIINSSTVSVTSDITNIGQKLNSTDPSLSILGLSKILNNELKAAAKELEKYDDFTQSTFKFINKRKTQAEVCFASIASCFAGGLATSAAVDVARYIDSNNLDSHANHERSHLNSQTQVWDSIAQLFTIFKAVPYHQKSLFDYTTFLVASEFSRTPYLNLSKGKDHNPYTNSILFAGKGINGNQIVGKSTVWSKRQTSNEVSVHTGLPINLKSGEVIRMASPLADMMTSENVARTLLEIFKSSQIPDALKKFPSLPNVKKT